ncbi:MAG: hypothetical protein U0350_33575 [Caldilineaceae bacterium]
MSNRFCGADVSHLGAGRGVGARLAQTALGERTNTCISLAPTHPAIFLKKKLLQSGHLLL